MQMQMSNCYGQPLQNQSTATFVVNQNNGAQMQPFFPQQHPYQQQYRYSQVMSQPSTFQQPQCQSMVYIAQIQQQQQRQRQQQQQQQQQMRMRMQQVHMQQAAMQQNNRQNGYYQNTAQNGQHQQRQQAFGGGQGHGQNCSVQQVRSNHSIHSRVQQQGGYLNGVQMQNGYSNQRRTNGQNEKMHRNGNMVNINCQNGRVNHSQYQNGNVLPQKVSNYNFGGRHSHHVRPRTNQDVNGMKSNTKSSSSATANMTSSIASNMASNMGSNMGSNAGFNISSSCSPDTPWSGDDEGCESPMSTPSLTDSRTASDESPHSSASFTALINTEDNHLSPSHPPNSLPSETVPMNVAKSWKRNRSKNVNIVSPPKSSATMRLTASLRWIIYSDHIDDYAEMLCKTEYVRLFVINQCAKHSSTHSACIKWSKKWNLVNHPQCAQAVYYAMSQQSKRKKASTEKTRNKEKELRIEGYDNLPLCTLDVMQEVLFVNDNATFIEARKVLLAEKKCIGLDLECMIKRFPVADAPKYCQILQIATTSKTVIFDLESIPSKYAPVTSAGTTSGTASGTSTGSAVAKQQSDTDDNNGNDVDDEDATELIDPKQFDDLLHDLLYDSSLLKIGMSFDSDVKSLGKQYPYFKSFKCIVKSYFELEDLLQFVRTKPGMRQFGVDESLENRIRDALKKTNTKREGGLATVVRHVLKKRLNKREQLSNWGHRPLRLSQLEYAAIDSAIEVAVYLKLEEMCPQLISSRKWICDLYRF